MFGRGSLFLLVLVAAFFIPYVISESGEDNPLAAWWNSMFTETTVGGYYPSTGGAPVPTTSPVPPISNGGAPYPMGAAGPGGTAVPAAPGEWRTVRVIPPGLPQQYSQSSAATSGIPSTQTGPIVQNGSDLIRFDLQPQYILQQWPRVSTHLQEGELRGMRVAVVSGTGLRDLAGSLTYYFDRRNTLQRVVFDGSTGDPAYLIEDLQKRFQLQPDSSFGHNVYLSRAEGQLTGWLQVVPAAVVRASQPYQRYDVELDLARPGSQPKLTSLFIPRSAQQSQPAVAK